MKRTEAKRLFDSIEEHIMEILQMADFLEVVCNEDFIPETGRFLYIIIKLFKKECDRLEIERIELKDVCLD